MDPITGMLLSYLPQLGGGILSDILSQGDRDEQLRMLTKNLADWEGTKLPELKDVQAEQLGPSSMEGVGTDPTARQAQYDALGSLQDIIRAGGLTLEDKANINRLNARNAQSESAGRARIAEDMAARGQYGGGAQLAMQLSNQQGAANRAAQTGLDTAAMAQRRGMDAILARGRMGGELRGQAFDEDSRRAQAKDLISRYNADSRSKAGYHNAMLPQQQFQNQVNINQGKSGARQAVADRRGQDANRTQQRWAGYGASGADLVEGLGEDPRRKGGR